MRMIVAIDDAQLEQARRLTNIRETSALIREALTALIERESARRLARLGGSEPGLRGTPSRRPMRRDPG